MEEKTILGAYQSARGGRIYLNMAGNIAAESMSATFYHEQCHAFLTMTTSLGLLQKMAEMEALLAGESHRKHAETCASLARLLVEKTRFVQEAYATSMELLMLEQEFGIEETLRQLRNMPSEYQDYYLVLRPVHTMDLSYKEKSQVVFALCSHAVNLEFAQDVMCDPVLLAAALSGENAPAKRLRRAVQIYADTGILPAKGDGPDRDRITQIVKSFPHVSVQVFPDLTHRLDRIEENLNGASMQQALERHMIEQACLFDPGRLPVKRAATPPDTDDKVFLVLKNVLNLENPDHFYLISREESCLSAEITVVELHERAGKALSVCMLLAERKEMRDCLAAWDGTCLLSTFLIQTYPECENWLHREADKASLYVGELPVISNLTDVRVLFFCERGKPQELYVFPTLGPIRDRLLNEYGLRKHLYSVHDKAFIKLFAYFDDELQILKYLQGLLSLLLDRTWKELMQHKTLAQFAAKVGLTLGNSAMAIKRPDTYKIMAALPFEDTSGAPLYTLMRFEGGENTADTHVDSRTKSPLLFPTKESADRYAAQNELPYSGVGVDRIFWPFFRNMAKENGGKVILVLDGDRLLGKLVEVDAVAAAWFQE